MYPLRDPAAFSRWAEAWDTLTEDDRAAIAEASARLPRPPTFALVLPPTWLLSGAAGLVASLARQPYPHWELWAEAGLELDGAETIAGRLRHYPAAAEGVAAGLNAALALTSADFVVPVPEDAVLSDAALFELAVAAVENPAAELIYTDEDRLDAGGQRFAPRFKAGWDPELILARDSIGLLAAYRAPPLRNRGGFPGEGGGLEPVLYALALEVVAGGDPGRVVHVPALACRRTVEPWWDPEHGRALVRAHLARAGQGDVRIVPAPLAPQWSRIVRPTPDPAPLVSVIVPTRDGAALLERCLDGLLAWTDYPALEVLIVDNGSEQPETFALFERLTQDPRVRILPAPGPFNFSALNNRAAEVARGEVLLLLNNDTEVIESGWLKEMVSHVVRPEVGAVGAKLLYEDGRVQHAGVVLGRGTEITHQLRLSEPDDPGPDAALALTRTAAAVTGACLAVRRAVFLEVGGLDEQHLAVGFNDIDFCLRLGDHGYRVVWTPFATLFHLESVSRGHEDTPEKRTRMMGELAWLLQTWGSAVARDRFHNTNLLLGWTESGLAAPPRRRLPWRETLG